MDWKYTEPNYSMATVDSGDSVDQAMAEFCQHIKTQVTPKNDSVAWDYLRVEMWSDSGRMIVYPASTLNPLRIEKAACQVFFSDLLSAYELIADSGLNDEAFVAEIIREEGEWIDRFLDAARRVGLFGKPIQFWDGDGDEPIRVEQI
ncbi:hypothetical protein [Paludisphaera borealis]|uniref:Uncharacterized protein n=1 Tax=Paludisphaera borealis TaxID=1387353 RepID=A0A1U7CTM3_9BACT|nr:hypothetical protein [Paludisphaera borealis]APW62300.1 hypothetical protein BSF38_03839 [Paludisphaera borealis]